MLAALAGWLAGRRIESPGEAGSDADPPVASNITVPVERRLLSSNVVTRGTVRFEESAEISLAGSTGTEGAAVVARDPPAEGGTLEDGDLLVEVTGRPTFVLAGQLPMFRQLGPGSTGDDVRQLEEALARFGFQPGTVDTVYDPATEAAVDAWYRAAGYEPVGPTSEQREQLDGARSSASQAREQVRQAEQALAEAQGGVKRSTRLTLDQQVADAQNEYNRTVSAAATAQAEADAAVATAEADLATARSDQLRADQRLATARAGTDPDDPTEPATPQLVATLDAEASAAAAAVRAAEAELARLQAAAGQVGIEQHGLIESARATVVIAEAQRDEDTQPQDASAARQALAEARTSASQAETSLAELDAEIGIVVPQSEVIFLEVLPRRIDAVAVGRGDVVEGAIMTVSGAEAVLDTSVPADSRPLVSVGDRALVSDAGLGVELDGTIAELEDEAGTDDVGEGRYFLRIDLPEGTDVQPLVGLNLQITIPVSSTDGEVLAVPIAALSAGADGSTRVQVEESGVVRFVDVAVGLRAQGFAEVRPVEGETLAEGDRVVVGGSADGAEEGRRGRTAAPARTSLPRTATATVSRPRRSSTEAPRRTHDGCATGRRAARRPAGVPRRDPGPCAAPRGPPRRGG